MNLGYPKLDVDSSTSGVFPSTPDVFPPTNAWSVDQQSGKVNVTFFGTLNLNGNDIINVNKILGMDGKWSIDENGKLIAKEIETEKIKSQKGYTVPDEDTGNLFCIKVKSGALIAAEGECGVFVPAETATSTP